MSNSESNINPASDGPRIIVDEDWKAQVEREREAIRSRNLDRGGDLSEADRADGEFLLPPPANLEGLVSMLASQAMASLGLLADPAMGEPNVNVPIAKYLIDLLGILEEKTKGNLSQDEESRLQDALHSMRMLYIEVMQQAAQPGASLKTESPETRPIIEVP